MIGAPHLFATSLRGFQWAQYDKQTPAALSAAVQQFLAWEGRFRPKVLRRNAERFSRERFKRNIETFVTEKWRDFSQ